MRSLMRCYGPTLLAGVIAALAATPSSALAQPDERLLGTWRLDVSKSKYEPGPPPVSETRIYSKEASGLKGLIRRRFADGRDETIEYGADFDHEYPVSGTKTYDAVKFKRIDALTAEAVLSHAGRVFGTARRTISEDGQTMTIVFRREDGASTVRNVAIYRKEAKP